MFQNKHVLLNNLSLAEPMSNLIAPEDSSQNFEYFRHITCWKSPKIKSQKFDDDPHYLREQSFLLKQDSLSFHFRIMKFKLKLWDLETMDFDGNGTNGFFVFQSLYFNADIMEKWGFFSWNSHKKWRKKPKVAERSKSAAAKK